MEPRTLQTSKSGIARLDLIFAHDQHGQTIHGEQEQEKGASQFQDLRRIEDDDQQDNDRCGDENGISGCVMFVASSKLLRQ